MIYFILYVFLETLISVNVFSQLGGLGAFVEIMGTAFLGALFLANFRATLAQSLQALAQRNLTPEGLSQISLFTVIGAFLLILPGVFSDILGLALQFSAVATLVSKRFAPPQNFPAQRRHDTSVIDVEVIEESQNKRELKKD